MTASVTHTGSADYQQGNSDRDEPPWRFLDLSGEQLGVRIEELQPGGTSSYHHYHSAEEEHVLVFYPDARVLLVKSGDRRDQYTYRERKQ